MDLKTYRETECDESESEAVLDAHRELALKAVECFSLGDFSASLTQLKQLQEERPLDTRFTHNAAVVDFYSSNFKTVGDFKMNLNSVCTQGEISLDNVDSLEGVGNCYIYFNQAVLLYHSVKYSSALTILNKIFTIIEALDENLRRGVTLLLAEVFLRVHQPGKALSVVSYVEDLLDQVSSSKKIANSNSEAESDEKVRKDINDVTESFKLKLKEYKCKCYLSLHNLEDVSKELNILSNNVDKIILKSDTFSEEIFEARVKNMKTNMKFLLAYSEYLKGNFKSSVHTVASIPIENTFELTGDVLSLALYNNLGCLHLYMGKPTLSTIYFRKALRENNMNRKSQSSNEKDQLLFTMGGNKLPQLMYNLGISLLHSGKPIEAFDCLTLAVQVFHMNPRLWLRLAECCIMVHKNGNERDFDFINKRKEVLEEVIGSGVHRKLVVNLNLFENNKYSYDAQSFAIPVASLEFATLCLKNALLLLSGTVMDYAPSNPMSKAQIVNLNASVLVASAYVSLCLGDSIVAVNNCRNILNIPDCSNTHKLLAHLYISEAFILLDRIPEALEYLKIDLRNYSFNYETTETGKSVRPWKPDTSASAKAVFQFNLAVVLAISGDLLKAADLLKQVWLAKSPQCEIPVQVISLALYIELSLGHADIARNIIKQNCPQYNCTS